MKEQRVFRLRWIVPALIAGLAVLYCVIVLYKGRTDILFAAGRVYQAVALLLIGAWLIERAVRLVVAFRHGVREQGWVDTTIDGMTTAAERVAEPAVQAAGTLARIAGALAVGVADAAKEMDRDSRIPPHLRSMNPYYDPMRNGDRYGLD